MITSAGLSANCLYIVVFWTVEAAILFGVLMIKTLFELVSALALAFLIFNWMVAYAL